MKRPHLLLMTLSVQNLRIRKASKPQYAYRLFQFSLLPYLALSFRNILCFLFRKAFAELYNWLNARATIAMFWFSWHSWFCLLFWKNLTEVNVMQFLCPKFPSLSCETWIDHFIICKLSNDRCIFRETWARTPSPFATFSFYCDILDRKHTCFIRWVGLRQWVAKGLMWTYYRLDLNKKHND